LSFFIYAINRAEDHWNAELINITLKQDNVIYQYRFFREPRGFGNNRLIWPGSGTINDASKLMISLGTENVDRITYYDNGKTYSWLVLFGGVGINFDMIEGKEYEISARRNFDWNLTTQIG
jgi:hypothetical protein